MASGAGLKRYISVLRLFDEEHLALTVPQIAEAIGSPPSSIYRHVRELLAEGFLESTVDSRYRLGPAFIDFTRRVRVTDPLLRSGSRLLGVMIEQMRVPGFALLCRLYGNQVMCVAVEKSGHVGFATSYELGRPMPLLRGATSKAVLANMPGRSLDKLLKNAQIDEATSAELTATLGKIRRSGYCVTSGEVDQGLTGMATMVHNGALGINASLSFIAEASVLSTDQQQQLLPMLLSTARVINSLLEEEASRLA